MPMSTSKAAVRKQSATPEPIEADDDLQARERFIVFLRHGIAEESSPEKPDEERALTAEGHARMKQIGRGLERALPRVQTIHASPLLRAVQTALWVSKGYRSRAPVNATDLLAPGAVLEELLDFVRTAADRRIVLVGHEPGLSEAVRSLLGLPAALRMELKKGGCYGVRLLADGTAVLEWQLTPRILRKLGE